eukprot:5975024-Pyramimonas_sp.AAC.1
MPFAPVAAASPFVWPNLLAQDPRPLHIFSDVKDSLAAAAAIVNVDAPYTQRTRFVDDMPKSAVPKAFIDGTLMKGEIQSRVMDCVSLILGTEISAGDPLLSAGLDSLGALEVRSALASDFGAELPGTLVFDYPSVEAITVYLSDLLDSDDGARRKRGTELDHASMNDIVLESSHTSDRDKTSDAVIHVVCTSMDNPYMAGGWRFDASTDDSIKQVPCTYWTVDDPLLAANGGGGVPARFGSFMRDVDLYDAICLGTSTSEAKLMDAQQRHLLHAALSVLNNNNNVATSHDMRASTSVMVGISGNEYLNMGGKQVHTYSATGGALSVASGRLSFTFGLQGPCMSVDTACSSSL